MANRIQLRRDGAQQWANINPILAQGELGIEIDTSRIKIGDGVTPWNSLKYERPLETESNAANTLVKRDADGNFQAGAITATLIGNASTATRFANARQRHFIHEFVLTLRVVLLVLNLHLPFPTMVLLMLRDWMLT